MIRFVRTLFLLVAGLGLAQCSNITTPSEDSDDPTATPTPTPTPEADYLFKVNLSSTWETGSTTVTSLGTCTIDDDSTAGGAVNLCTITVPEGQLYFSKLKFSLTVADESCDLVNFRPYWYRRSDAAGFTPAGTSTPIDCDAPLLKDRPIGCFGGAARELAPSFPVNTGLIYFTESGGTVEVELSSGNTIRQSASEGIDNRWAANDKVDTTDATGWDDYVASSTQHYEYMCRDKHYEPLYLLRIIIDEINPNASDQINGWNPDPSP